MNIKLARIMPFKNMKSVSDNDAKKPKRITIETKKEIITKHDNGVRVSDLAKEYDMAKSTICTILAKKAALRTIDVAKGVTMLSKQRSQVLEDVEKLLLVWINEKQLAGDSVSEATICEKALLLHSDLVAKTPNTSDGSVLEFKASRGWFEKFRRRTGIHSVRHGEAGSSDKKVAGVYVDEFVKFIKCEGYVPHQVFNCDETGLFWKKMPRRTYITQEEKSLPGHKPMKDRLTLLLCANASGDSKIKVNEEDVVDLVEDHKQELNTEELVKLQREQIKVLQEELSGEETEEEVNVTSAEIKEICSKWNEVQVFIEKHHPDKTVSSRAVDILNDNVMSHFRKIIQKRKRQEKTPEIPKQLPPLPSTCTSNNQPQRGVGTD